MRHRSMTLVAIVSLVSATCVFGEACSSPNAVDSHERDPVEIEKLPRRDVAGTLVGGQIRRGHLRKRYSNPWDLPKTSPGIP